MPYVYLLHPPHFKDDVYKIGGSEHMDNCSLKSYGKGTEILAMIVINGNYLAREMGLKGYSKLKKEELIRLIKDSKK